MQTSLSIAGFVANSTKLLWEPTQLLVWLGLNWNLLSGSICAFEGIGLSRRDCGFHSLRAGGASAAANAQVSDRLFKRHGRWKSEKAKDDYIRDNTFFIVCSLSLGI